MQLTSDYRRVKALFDTPIGGEEIGYEHQIEESRSEFTVGPFLYVVSFISYGLPPGVIEVDFKFVDIEYDNDQELVKIISEMEHREVSVEEAKQIKQLMIYDRYRQILNLGGTYSIRIFGKVINIMKDYVEKYHPKCLVFTSGSQGRTDLYHRMVKRVFPQASIKLKPLGSVIVKFQVCFEK